LTVYKINEVIKEGELNCIIDNLIEENEARILAKFESESK
jgi:protein subunit release factor A